MNDIGTWLEQQGLGKYVEVFAENEIDFDVLEQLTIDELQELGIPLGARKRILNAIAARSASLHAASVLVASTQAPANPLSDAERRHLTVMFCDLVASTRLSIELELETYSHVLSVYQDAARAVIASYGGFIARYMGDGLLVYFGYPQAHEDDAERAVRAGLHLAANVQRLDVPTKEKLAVRVGIASGIVLAGDIVGEGTSEEHAVLGETPNLAARLQASAEPNSVVVSESTRRLVEGRFECRALGRREFKGISDPVPVFQAVTVRSHGSRFEAMHRGSLTPLRGRDTELSLLSERWELARGGEGQAVLLVGEAGIGKSRITQALLEQMGGERNRSLVYQCSPLHADSPLWPVLEQLRVALRLNTPDPTPAQHERLLSAYASTSDVNPEDVLLIAEALDLPPDAGRSYPSLPAQQKRLRIMQLLLQHVLGLARARPLLIVVEDVHWIDPSTRDLIEALLQSIGESRVMLLLSTRTEGAAFLAAHPNVTTLTLNKLGRRAVREMIEAIEGARSLSEQLLGNIVSRTDGVPLFVEELTKAVIETDASLAASSNLAGTPGIASPIPETLHDSLMARLDKHPALKRTAQTAACIGREFQFGLLQSISELSSDALIGALDELASAGLIFKRGIPPAAQYLFKHALVRDAAYESMLIAQRRDVHERVVNALERTHAQTAPELIAIHAVNTGDNERAIKWFVAAGLKAAQSSANAEAVNHYRQALDELEALADGPLRDARELEILQALGVPLIASCGYPSQQVEHAFRRASGLTETLSIDDQRRFTVLRGLWNCLYDQSKLKASTELARDLIALATRHGDASEMALANRALGSTLFVQGDLAGASDAFQSILETPSGWSTPATRVLHGEAPEVSGALYAGWVSTLQGFPDRGLGLVQTGLERARGLDMPLAIAFSLSIMQTTLYLRGDREDCARVAYDQSVLCEKYGFPFWNAPVALFDGWAQARFTHKRSDVFARMRAGLEAWTSVGANLHVPTWSCLLADVAIDFDAPEEAQRVLRHARVLAEQNNEVVMLPELLRLQARLEQARGQTNTAMAMLENALEIASVHGSAWLALPIATDLAELLFARGDAAIALRRLECAVEAITEGADCLAFRNATALREGLLRAI